MRYLVAVVFILWLFSHDVQAGLFRRVHQSGQYRLDMEVGQPTTVVVDQARFPRYPILYYPNQGYPTMGQVRPVHTFFYAPPSYVQPMYVAPLGWTMGTCAGSGCR